MSTDMAEEQNTEGLELEASQGVDVGNEDIAESEHHDAVSEEEDPGEQHEFQIIDQVESDEDGDGGSKEGGDGKDRGEDGDESSDTDFDDSQLHEMLEKGIDKDSITAKKNQDNGPTDGQPLICHKVVLQDFESDPFDILPEGWVCATHNCGMPIYLHKESRVCTMARPYSLGSASTRRHDIPISAIPCLQYRTKLKGVQKKNDKLDDPITTVVEKATTQETTLQKDEISKKDDKIPSTQHNCDQQENSTVTSSDSSATTPQKMWMVTQDSSGKCPSQRKPEELHTGKTDFTEEISQVEPNSQLTTSHSNNSNANHTDNPHSPAGENIAVTYDSSTPLKFEAYDGGYYSASTEVVKSLCFQEDDNRDKDVSITKECLEKEDPDSLDKKMKVEDDKGIVFNSEVGESAVSDQKPASDSSNHNNNNIVVEETSSNIHSTSELVTSNTSTISSIKRKVEDLKRKGAKYRKLLNGEVEECSPASDNNIAVNVLDSMSQDQRLRKHAAEIKIVTAKERAKESLLDKEAVHEYCATLFKFKTIVVKKYRTWRERRKHLLGENRNNRPELPVDTKLITCPIGGNANSNRLTAEGKKKEFVLNPSGKSYLCILHEYMQRTLKIKPTYALKELENPKTPYGATVMIDNIEYGTGLASSKKMARQEAAKETLKILIPDLASKISDEELKNTITDVSFFDEIKVEDPRIYELGNKVGQPSPFQLLRECLRRNFGMGATHCTVTTKALKNQKCEFSINVGKHSATIVAKNKRDGKQLAAQAVLAKLHPHFPSWGSLLRLYATNVEKPMEKVEEMNEIKTHVPNNGVLESLREEMRKLHKQKSPEYTVLNSVGANCAFNLKFKKCTFKGPDQMLFGRAMNQKKIDKQEAIQSKGKMIISTKGLPSKMSCVDL